MVTVAIRESTWVLARGAHRASSGQACLLEVASLKAEEPFSDQPMSVSPVLAGFGRTLWDSTPPERSLADLVAFADRLIGTAGRPDLDDRAGLMAADWAIRRFPGPWLRLAGLDEHADALTALPELTSWTRVESAKTIASSAERAAAEATTSVAARDAAWDAARDAAWAVAWDAARAAAWDASRDAAWSAAWSAASSAARSAAWDAAEAAAWDAAWSAASSAAWSAASSAARSAARSAASSAARSAAWDAAEAAARGALAPTANRQRDEAVTLFDRMISLWEITNS